MARLQQSPGRHALALLLMLVVLVVDLNLELGVAGGVPYVAVILVALKLPGRKPALLFAIACTALVLLGWAWSPAGGETWKVAANRALAVFAIWVVAALSLRQRRAEEQFREALVASPSGFFLVDREGRISMANARAEEIFGYGVGGLTGLELGHLVPPRFRGVHAEQFTAFVKAPQPRRMGTSGRFQGLRLDGTEIPLQIGLGPIEDDGRPLTVVSVVDVSEQARVEVDLRQAQHELRQRAEELRRSEASYRIVARNADGLAVVDGDGYVLFSNPAADRVLGGAGTAVGTAFPLPLVPDDTCERELPTGVDGASRIVEVRTSRVRWEEKDAWLAVLRDVTERKGLRDQIDQAQKLSLVARLAGGVAHDFNNILMAVVGSAELGGMAGTLEEAQAHLRDIDGSARRGEALTRSLLALGRGEPSETTSVDLPTVINEARPLIQRMTGDGVQLEVSHQCRPLAVLGSRLQIEQILMNLVTNSRDAVGGEGWVLVSTLQLGAGEPLPCGCQRTPGLGPSCSIITVEDDGMGLDPQVRAHAFEPFFTTKEVGEGAGLGLSSVYAIVGRLGGHVCLKDRVPRGAVCHVVLPGGEPSEELDEVAERVRAQLAGRILVADDEAMIRNVLASRLRRSGLDVLVAADGVDAARWQRRVGRSDPQRPRHAEDGRLGPRAGGPGAAAGHPGAAHVGVRGRGAGRLRGRPRRHRTPQQAIPAGRCRSEDR